MRYFLRIYCFSLFGMVLPDIYMLRIVTYDKWQLTLLCLLAS